MFTQTEQIFDIMFDYEEKEVGEISAPSTGHNDFVDQFLDLSPREKCTSTQTDILQECHSEEKLEQEFQEKHKQGKSFNHNSQKHTVVTLQHLLSIKAFTKNSEEHEIIRKMWSEFIKTKKKTKEILSILFGCVDAEKEQDKILFQQYKLGEILKYPTISIRNAQNMLREAACEQLTQARIDQELIGRRINSKTHFKQYLMNFIQQIRDRPLRNRNQKAKVDHQDELTQFLNF